MNCQLCWHDHVRFLIYLVIKMIWNVYFAHVSYDLYAHTHIQLSLWLQVAKVQTSVLPELTEKYPKYCTLAQFWGNYE